jgi:hypothetical protein
VGARANSPLTRRLVLALIVTAAAALLTFRSVYEPDLGYHLAHGREAFSGHIVRTNLFSFTYPNYPQPYTSWLWDTGAYASWRLGGDTGVQTFQMLLLATALAFAYSACRVRATALPSVAMLVLGFLVLEPRAIPRPHVASFAGLAACVWIVERARADRSVKPLLWTIPIVALWANAHVESLFGVLMLGLFGVAEALAPSALTRRDGIRASIIAAAGALALMATPYGWGLFRYLYENFMLPQLLNIAELRPAYLPTYRAFFVYVSIAALLLASQPKRLTLWEVVSAVIFGALGYRYLRLTPLVFFVTAPMLAYRLTRLTERGPLKIDGRAMLVTTLAAALFISRAPVTTLVRQVHAGALFPETMFSSRAVTFVRERQLSGPMFNSNNLGGWIEWTLYPQARVLQDSRLQSYPPDHWRRILAPRGSQDSWDVLIKDVDWAMLSRPRPNQLSGAGRFARTTWATVYWDEAVEVLVRRAGRYATVASNDEYQFVTPDTNLSVLATQLPFASRARIAAEAQRNRAENPRGFVAVAALCLTGDSQACRDVDRLAAEDPSLQNEAALVRILRVRQ